MLVNIQKTISNPARFHFSLDERLTLLTAALILIASGFSLLAPDFYQGFGHSGPDNGLITSNLAAMTCIPFLTVSIFLSRFGGQVTQLVRPALLIFLSYTYAFQTFSFITSPLTLLYVLIFCLGFYTAWLSTQGFD